ncbi:hypothetical protein JTB14_035674 [Gonioctena quinquepunctata]|nr:hypothetical protein JTB14_035674 [Gonioctena quinquepunctata]
MIIAMWVDDFSVFYNNKKDINIVGNELNEYSKMKNLGTLPHCIGMKIEENRSKELSKVSQKTFFEDTSTKFGMEDTETVSIPMEPNSKLVFEGEICTNKPHQQLIGCIMWLVVCTRPDIAFATYFLSQFNNAHTTEHWLSAKRVLRY